jgi:hypothetical protein
MSRIQPKSRVRNFLNSALISIPTSGLTEITEDIWDNFNDNEIIVKYGEEKSILATIPNSVRFRPRFTSGRKFFVRTNSYNSWKALEAARKAERLNELMARFNEHLADTGEYRQFNSSQFKKLVNEKRISENDYNQSTEYVRSGISPVADLPVTRYTRKTAGGSKKRRRSTKHRKTKRR